MDERADDPPGRYLPIALDLHGRRCVVVGAGPVGLRRAAQLAEAGARVTLIAPGAEAAAGVEVLARAFAEEDLADCAFVAVATDDGALNARIAEAARRRGVLVTVADAAALSDLIMPAVMRRGPVTLAVTTEGASPALAALLRDLLAAEVGQEWGELAEMLAELRAAWRPTGLTQEQRAEVWRRIVALRLDRYIASGRADKARAIAERMLAEYSAVEPNSG